MPPLTRTELRTALAEKVCSWPHQRLLEYGITRCGDVTGLDVIGLPVYTSCRPAGKVIAVSSGKGLTKKDAKAGAIIESMELWAAENPSDDATAYCNHLMAREHLGHPCLALDKFPLCRDSILTDKTPVSWDLMQDLSGNPIYVPSDLIWLTERIPHPFAHFQSSSNGLASGVTLEDALLQATYELVERDGWAISDFVRAQIGLWPTRVAADDGPPQIQLCIDRLYNANVVPFIFDLATDLEIPIFSCILIPGDGASPGIFAGYGCSLDPCTAVRRAITEAAQARACYISGGRDDLFRRRFLSMKHVDVSSMILIYQSLPVARNFSHYAVPSFVTIEEEWKAVRDVFERHEIDIYYKIMHQLDDLSLIIVRCVTPDLASAPWENWSPNPRCTKAIETRIHSLK